MVNVVCSCRKNGSGLHIDVTSKKRRQPHTSRRSILFSRRSHAGHQRVRREFSCVEKKGSGRVVIVNVACSFTKAESVFDIDMTPSKQHNDVAHYFRRGSPRT